MAEYLNINDVSDAYQQEDQHLAALCELYVYANK